MDGQCHKPLQRISKEVRRWATSHVPRPAVIDNVSSCCRILGPGTQTVQIDTRDLPRNVLSRGRV